MKLNELKIGDEVRFRFTGVETRLGLIMGIFTNYIQITDAGGPYLGLTQAKLSQRLKKPLKKLKLNVHQNPFRLNFALNA